MTPRAYWDIDGLLWQAHPLSPRAARVVWDPRYGPRSEDQAPWVSLAVAERRYGLVGAS